MRFYTAQTSPWDPYSPPPGQEKKKPVVPEPAFAGAVALLLAVLFVLWIRRSRRGS